jgi:TctA family transporter
MKKLSRKQWLVLAVALVVYITFAIIIFKVDDTIYYGIMFVVLYISYIIMFVNYQIKRKKEIEVKQDASSKDRKTALFLLGLFGIFGVHRFYVGKTGTGILMVLFGWLTFGIWWLIDVIMIATGAFKDSEGKRIVQK